MERVGYTGTAKWLHWGSAALWIAAWILGFLAVYARDWLNPDHGLTIWHKAIASVIIFLTVIRLIWRFTHRVPDYPLSMTPFMQRAAHAGHGLLYVFALILLPLSGWFWSSVADKPITLLGLFPLFPLVPPNPDLYDVAKAIHVFLAWFSGLLVAGHILIAWKHHFIDRDAILRDMLPKRR